MHHQQGAIMTPAMDECRIKASRSTQGGGQGRSGVQCSLTFTSRGQKFESVECEANSQ